MTDFVTSLIVDCSEKSLTGILATVVSGYFVAHYSSFWLIFLCSQTQPIMIWFKVVEL